jgi:Ribose 5-phosphate isomerase RpiB
MQTIHIASDHAGYALKEHLVQFLAQKGINVVDDGTHSTESCDYPVLAHKLAPLWKRSREQAFSFAVQA